MTLQHLLLVVGGFRLSTVVNEQRTNWCERLNTKYRTGYTGRPPKLKYLKMSDFYAILKTQIRVIRYPSYAIMIA